MSSRSHLEYQRTTLEEDGVSNPYFALLAKEAAELIFGQVEIKPSFLAELPYRSGPELYVEQLVGQSRRLAINYDIHEAAKGLVDSHEDNHTILHLALSESIDRALSKICAEAGVGDQISKEMLINKNMLGKWLRALTVLSLHREFAEYQSSKTLVAEVADSILGDQNPTKWKKSKQRKEFQNNAFRNDEASLKNYLQNYIDNFDEK